MGITLVVFNNLGTSPVVNKRSNIQYGPVEVHYSCKLLFNILQLMLSLSGALLFSNV